MTSVLVILAVLALPLPASADTVPAQAEAAAVAHRAATASPDVTGADALRARYAAAIRDAIIAQWSIAPSVPSGARCRVAIRQLPGGAVVSVQADEACQFDAAGRAGLERAVLRAQPLPYRGFELVFDRALNIEFTAPR
ncbi:MAG: TonB C-terminal domain-containing protein [Stenotrophomonas chelatiphaga]